jgi:hypothetical protein
MKRGKYSYIKSGTHRETKVAYEIHKAIPLQAWTGADGSRRLRLPDLKTIGT